MNPLLIVPIFIVFFAVMWMGVISLIAVIGGWRSLAAAHPLPSRPLGEGTRYGMQSVRLGFLGSYNSVITATLYRDAIALVPMKIFSLLHPVVYIPFTAMTDFTSGKFILTYVSFRAGGRKIRIMGASAEALRKAMGG